MISTSSTDDARKIYELWRTQNDGKDSSRQPWEDLGPEIQEAWVVSTQMLSTTVQRLLEAISQPSSDFRKVIAEHLGLGLND